ncbi:hypothetical protein EV669_101342 [Gulbenkiania mobilis]|uniref:PilZ domain-containing protein n=1 Tax=Gulbenkiania mobilis TaxID=397457 RepID=A0ABY2D1A8_GULMO|nr:hypothetical protein EV669_101342 [Gulbenkiania mobilis]
MLDFFVRNTRRRNDPLADAEAAATWVAELKAEFGSAAHERVTDLVSQAVTDGASPDAGRIDAVLRLNLDTASLHQQLGLQYLMNGRLPKLLEEQVRSQILDYGQAFISFYRLASQPGSAASPAQVALMLSRSLFFLGERARWQFYRHRAPQDGFWLQVNEHLRCAEQWKAESLPICLFNEERGTTVQDQFLILQMLATLTSGNLSTRQLNFSHELLRLVSDRMTLHAGVQETSSFVVDLLADQPAHRPRAQAAGGEYRGWSTADMVEILHGWAGSLEGGRTPEELRRLIEPGIDATLLRVLCREWAPRQMLFARAERVSVKERQIEVAHRLPVLHRLIRKPEEEARSRAAQAGEGFEEATDIRIYGFVTTRRRDRMSALAPAAEAVALHDEFAKWELDNISLTGLGVTFEALGNEWAQLGTLLGIRHADHPAWQLGLVRRLKRQQGNRVYLGIELLSDRPVAAAIRPADTRVLDPSLAPELVWSGGLISLFVALGKGGKTVNALILPLSAYTLGKQYVMSARGKYFLVALGKVAEKGLDWCLAEVELVRTLQGPEG